MSNTHSGHTPIAQHTGSTIPNRNSKAHRDVPLKHRFPCTTILIHGVNDLGTDFGTVESGLCDGLNDRLARNDLKAGTYTHGRMANDPNKVKVSDLMKNLDDTIYRRQEPEGTKSPLIPFYWGFKASSSDVAKEPDKQKVNGQYVDQFGNRLDVHRAKNGGMFANATTNIPDMFNTHFQGGLKTKFLDWKQGDVTHPLREAPSRHYMVLAAKRLAALVRQIRLIDPDGTVNIIAHSQGTLISLLAQAFLVNGINGKSCGPADRPADTLILIDSPYSLAESTMDRRLQTGGEQQTIWARVKTLANLTGLVASCKHSTPTPDKLKVINGQNNYGVTGPTWDPHFSTRLTGPQGNTSLTFVERDNRGKVYVYFCPEDATVGLRGVNGMGCIGLPDYVNTGPASPDATLENTGLVSDTLRQRIFTRRLRGGQVVQVGRTPERYTLREPGESSHGASGVTAWFKQAQVEKKLTRNINGEQLVPPFDPDLEKNRLPGTGEKALDGDSPNEFEAGKQSIDQVEAETAVSASELQQLPSEVMDWPSATVEVTTYAVIQHVPAAGDVAQALNQGKVDPDDHCEVAWAVSTIPIQSGKILVARKETPNEAKVRLMNELQPEDSYHSAVMSGPNNHRGATAYDVSIGQARAIDDPTWAALLRAVADWRIPLTDIQDIDNQRYSQLDATTRHIVEANCTYYKDGTFPPEDVVPTTPPPPIVSENVKAKNQAAMIRYLEHRETLGTLPGAQ